MRDLRTVHLIPAAFDYFDDIQEAAFGLVDALNYAGIPAEPFTIDYEMPTRARRARLAEISPGRQFQGASHASEMKKLFTHFDLVHLHCPLFGGAGDLLRLARLNPAKPVIITWYRPLFIRDVFSLGLRLYNAYYLPRLAEVARYVIACGDPGQPLNYFKEKSKLLRVETNTESLKKLLYTATIQAYSRV